MIPWNTQEKISKSDALLRESKKGTPVEAGRKKNDADESIFRAGMR